MSDLILPVNAGPLPPGYCASSAQSYLTDITALMSVTFAGGTMFYMGPTAPSPDLNYSLWARTNADGSLEGIYGFSGVWRREHPIPPNSKSDRLWKGTEGDLWKEEGGDGSDPNPFMADGITPNPGYVPPTDFTGAMWMVDHDLDFRIPVGCGTNPTQYPITNSDGTVTTPPATIINPGDNGGEEKHYVQAAETGGADHVHVLASEKADGSSRLLFPLRPGFGGGRVQRPVVLADGDNWGHPGYQHRQHDLLHRFLPIYQDPWGGASVAGASKHAALLRGILHEENGEKGLRSIMRLIQNFCGYYLPAEATALAETNLTIGDWYAGLAMQALIRARPDILDAPSTDGPLGPQWTDLAEAAFTAMNAMLVERQLSVIPPCV